MKIIPAEPGYYVLSPVFRPVDNLVHDFLEWPVIAWACDMDGAQPITLTGRYPKPAGVRCPDGRVFLPDDHRFAEDDGGAYRHIRASIARVIAEMGEENGQA